MIRQAKLMALFAELDPDPLLRVNKKGEIIETNKATRELFEKTNLKKAFISDLLTGLVYSVEEVIANGTELNFIESINDRIFSITIKGDNSFNFANIYLRDITRLKKYEYELEEYKNNLKTLADRLEQKFENERNYISTELHDDIGQRLILINHKLSRLSNNEQTEEIMPDVNDVYQRIREISHMLKPPEIDDFGLNIALKTLVERISKGAGIKGDYSYLGEDERLNSEVEITLYRIIQEAINNILKHAQAEEFFVQLVNKENEINLIISDDGVGIPQEYFQSKDIKNSGIGLFNMKERLEKINGKIKIQSAQGEGTSLFIDVPKQVVYENNTNINSR
ncbi:MAG: sensor histidine kinase [bacterium]